MTTTKNGGSDTACTAVYSPRFDIHEDANQLTLLGELPGVKSEDLEVVYDAGELSIRGKVQPRNQNYGLLSGEYGVGDFARTFAIDTPVDSAAISARLDQGVLTIELPKRAEAKARRIEVSQD